MTTNQKIFKKLSKEKSLYPKEVIPMLNTLFSIIGVEFDVSESIKTQLGWRKKEEYEKLLNRLTKSIQSKDINELDGSVRYVLSKSIKKEIFKNLNFFYYFNLYSEKDRRKQKERIDEILFKIYEILPDTDYILPEEIDLLIDWEPVPEKKVLDWLNSIKKNKIALIKTNRIYNNYLLENENENPLPEIVNELEEKTFQKPSDMKIYLQNVNFVTKDLESPKLITEEDKLFLFLSEQDFYYFSKWILRKYNKENKLVLNLNPNFLTRINHNKFSKNWVEYIFSDDIKYFDSVNVHNFKYWEERVILSKSLDNVSSKAQKKLKKFQNNEYKKEVIWYDKNDKELKDVQLIKQLEIKGRIYTDFSEIYYKLSTVDENEPLRIIFWDWTKKLIAKNFWLFILLSNKNLIKNIKYKMITKKIEDKILFSYEWINIMNFNNYVQTFLEYIKEDYEYEYDWLKIIELQTKWFNKGSIKKYERTSKYQLDFIENKVNFSKLLKNLG